MAASEPQALGRVGESHPHAWHGLAAREYTAKMAVPPSLEVNDPHIDLLSCSGIQAKSAAK